ncbi:MAG: c-type cytochrome [Chitinophagaceae bacterium]|nr:c-type cytochrome [Chitinophagaceae bacterium]
MRLRTGIAILLSVFIIEACNTGEPGKLSGEDTIYAGDLFKANIRTTEALSPEEERLGFRLPEGFEINLFAAEPDIGKPMNIAFDARGRMWVTQSHEYPFPAKPGKGGDKVTILEDTDGDGRADKFTTFSDTLNIPIGVLPVGDGVIAYSIPNIYKYSDTNGDDHADQQTKLLGPFKTQDTHGMINNFVRGFDGWIHSCHGFTNRDTVAGKDGKTISMISGNTFRFLPDGSTVEHTTDGRINPFGLVYDEKGYLYSTDCHTSPLYQLIRGADYTQWGKEEDMGFAPDMTPLSDEATALAGIAYYGDVLYPAAFRSNFFVGDVVRCRVYRYATTFKDATPIGKREEDFLLSKDPWFRPVDVKMGPDGAIYVADFYNSIIGHYEVPLDHPKRDHIRGRIWRITYKGKHNPPVNLAAVDVQQLLQTLDADNMSQRMLATDQLTDRVGQQSVPPLIEVLKDQNTGSRKYVHALWALQRLGALDMNTIRTAANHADPLIRLHTMRILAERTPDTKELFPLVVNGLKDKDPHVKRAATELLSRYPGMESFQLALTMRQEVPETDTHQLYTTRMSLRDLLRNSILMKEVLNTGWTEKEVAMISDVLMAVPSRDAAIFLYKYVNSYKVEENRAPAIYKHIARYGPEEDIDKTVRYAMQENRPGTADILIFKGIRQGIAQRGLKGNAALESWGRSLTENILKNYTYSKDASSDIIKMQTFAVQAAGEYKMVSAVPVLMSMLKDTRTSDLTAKNQSDINDELVGLKVAAIRSLIKTDVDKAVATVRGLFENKGTDNNLKIQAGRLLGEFPGNVVTRVFEGVKNPSPQLQTDVAVTLSGSLQGKDILLGEVSKGNILPRILLQQRVLERILLDITPGQKKKLDKLTDGISPVNQEREAQIFEQADIFGKLIASGKRPLPDSGRMVFSQNCSPCHSIGGEGGSIGPNLDGVSQWGAKPLLEKIIDPNRNISENFRTYTIKLKDGKTLAGLYRREEGATLIFADIGGKEFSVSKNEIKEQVPSTLTLMPDNFGERLTQHDFNNLIYFLLNPKP